MAKGVNKVFLLGNVGKDPEIRSTAGGMTVASFSLATADRAKDAQGNWADKTEWHNIVCFQRTAEVVRDYVKKGSQILVEGKIQTRSWDDKASGEKKYKTEILCNELTLLGGKADGGSSGGGGSYTKASSSSSSSYSQAAPATAPDYGDHGITDDDIPF
jgi:single-strand DNA-binding protein